jgi:hypothetical protein
MTIAEVEAQGMGAIRLLIQAWSELNGTGKARPSGGRERLEIYARYRDKWLKQL